MKTSQAGVNLIKKWEGFEAKPYRCSAGKLTIGYGHVILPGENLKEVTEPEAMELLRKDLAKFEAHVERLVAVDLTQNQFDALVSFCYNLGPANLNRSTLLKKVNAKDFAGAEKEFIKWAFAGGKKLKGLENRRKEEAAMFGGKA